MFSFISLNLAIFHAIPELVFHEQKQKKIINKIEIFIGRFFCVLTKGTADLAVPRLQDGICQLSRFFMTSPPKTNQIIN